MADGKRRRKLLVMLLFIGYLSLLLSVTLFTHNYYTYGQSSNLLIFSSVRLMLMSGNSGLILKNVIGNIVLFMPLGILLPLLIEKKQAFRWQLLFAVLISLVIEICQFWFAARIFDIDDIMLNVAGALAGRLILSVFRLFVRRIVIFYSGFR
ncbi:MULTISPECIES: VanZ family protein [unclassified Sporolactobacillus]|uniref:VanZ family protein n=1 Tax=unclassified Sporolactobacillus TaxID=2628533 RepID=UPI0023679650|nr:VanZ family protein [Sporolactobacillus sp. CQH2019]MDD9150380.1 VanZ family protein [Sporolactobacillus sp. CQH2019]